MKMEGVNRAQGASESETKEDICIDLLKINVRNVKCRRNEQYMHTVHE